MLNSVDEIKYHYTYNIQPVQLFETHKSKNTQNSSFDFINQMKNSSKYNPFHPDISNSYKGNRLDLIC